jgi:hypothetical protein
MPNPRNLHQFYGLFPTLLLNRESEEMIHDEGLLARFWGAWFDACRTCWDTLAAEVVNGNPFAVPMGNRFVSMGWPMTGESATGAPFTAALIEDKKKAED